MGEIINSRILDGKVICKVLLENEEVLSLKSAMRNVNIFCANQFTEEIKLIKRGKSGVTKYFEIPFKLRFRKTKEMKEMYYQKLETSSKIFYIYIIKKERLL